MQTANLKSTKDLSEKGCGPISLLAAPCCKIVDEKPVFDAAAFEAAATAADYRVEYSDAKHGAWAWVKQRDVMLAQGYSSSREDALAHAVFGAVREEHARKMIADALAERGVAAAPDVLLKMEQQYITQGEAAFLSTLKSWMPPALSGVHS